MLTGILQSISNVAWSFSKLEHFHPTLTRALAEETIAISSTLGSRDVPQLAWALCTAFAAEATSAGIGKRLFYLCVMWLAAGCLVMACLLILIVKSAR